MSYSFRQDETLSAAVSRVATELLELGVHHLEGNEAGLDDSVHEARKRLKELRALLRLVRRDLGKELFTRENRYYREEARKLSSFRDREVAVNSLRDLLGTDAEDEKSRNLLQRLEKGPEGAAEVKLQIQAVSAALTGGMARISNWHPVFEKNLLKFGLRKTYRDGCEAFAKASGEGSDENLHEWRKRVKDLWYHLQLVRKAAPPILEPLASLLHELSDHLGDDHDLAVLRTKLSEHKDLLKELPARDRLLRKIRRRRQLLQKEAWRLGELVYAETPNGFASRIDAYWKGWRKT